MPSLEVVPLVGPPRRIRIEVGAKERVGDLLNRLSGEIHVSGAFFKLVARGRVLGDEEVVEDVIRAEGSTLYFYPEAVGG